MFNKEENWKPIKKISKKVKHLEDSVDKLGKKLSEINKPSFGTIPWDPINDKMLNNRNLNIMRKLFNGPFD